MAEVARWRMVVKGWVQGVAFRYYTVDQALALGVRGGVRNLANGDVEIVAEGNLAALRKLREWAQHGPPAARVTGLATEESPATGEFADFRVRR